ncbi:unnamed protein product [Boreogadus saida]
MAVSLVHFTTFKERTKALSVAKNTTSLDMWSFSCASGEMVSTLTVVLMHVVYMQAVAVWIRPLKSEAAILIG